MASISFFPHTLHPPLLVVGAPTWNATILLTNAAAYARPDVVFDLRRNQIGSILSAKDYVEINLAERVGHVFRREAPIVLVGAYALNQIKSSLTRCMLLITSFPWVAAHPRLL